MNNLAASTPSPGQQQKFATVSRGYHPGQVDQHIGFLRSEIRRLEKLAEGGAARIAHIAESPRGQQAIVDLMRIAVDEMAGNRAQAQAEIAQMISDAEGHAAQVRQQASDEAASLIAGARQQADTIISGARADAKRMTDRASAEATAVSEGAGRRMDALRQLHATTRQKMTEIRDVMDRALAAENERGSLDDEVSRLTSAVPAAKGNGPAQLPAALPPAG